MKIFYIECLINNNNIDQIYLIDTGFGTLLEFNTSGLNPLTYDNLDEFYKTFGGKKRFQKFSIITRVV